MIKALDFEYSASITALSEKQFNAHMGLYKGYVAKVNEITEKLNAPDGGRQDSNAVYSYYRGLKESESFAIDGCILHELYFENIGGDKGIAGTKTKKIIDVQFGGFDAFAEDLKACCKAARGWCVFLYEPRTDSFRNIMLDAHNVGENALGQPILVIDMYEHAYFYDYLADKGKYIDNIFQNINWDVVENRVGYILKSKPLV